MLSRKYTCPSGGNTYVQYGCGVYLRVCVYYLSPIICIVRSNTNVQATPNSETEKACCSKGGWMWMVNSNRRLLLHKEKQVWCCDVLRR